MTLAEVADYLKIAKKTVLRMVHANKIPCAKIGGQWRFVRPVIDDWLLSRMQVVPRNDLAKLVEKDVDSIQLSRLVAPEFIITDIRPGTKQAVLSQLIEPLAERGIIKDSKRFLDGLIEREEAFSTAIGSGIALPHLRNPKENPIAGPALIIGICPEGTDFEAADSGKTYLFFILSTDSETVHLRLMSKLTSMLQNEELIERFKAADSADEVISALIRADYEMNKERWRIAP